MENKNYFKENLKTLRQGEKLGQVELSQKTGLSKSSISAWENGISEPTMSALIVLAKYFGVSIDYLVGLEK